MPPSRIVVAAAVLTACGPKAGATDDGGAANGGASSAAGSNPGPSTPGDSADGSIPSDSPDDPVPPPPPEYCGDGTLQDAWVHIDGSALDARDALVEMRVVDGSVRITRAPDADLSFLECIREITGDLVIHDSDALVDASGIANLERLGGNLVVADNDALTELDALHWVEEIEREPTEHGWHLDHSIAVLGNRSLQRIGGLSSLVVVWGDLLVTENPALIEIGGLARLQAVGGVLAISHNPSLCISHVDAIGAGIEQPNPPPDEWTTIGNDEGC